jgi:pSer/pThr/pTyr-binding forkhead associated (FHA) protein
MDRSSVGKTAACLVDEAGRRIIVQPNRATRLGRADDNEVTLIDDRSSRHHAAITSSNGRFSIRDLGSTNGTFVDEVRITEQQLSDGDVIRVGDTRLVFRYLS